MTAALVMSLMTAFVMAMILMTVVMFVLVVFRTHGFSSLARPAPVNLTTYGAIVPQLHIFVNISLHFLTVVVDYCQEV